MTHLSLCTNLWHIAQRYEPSHHLRLFLLVVLHRARAAGQAGQLAVFRLVVRNSVEERLLQLTDR
jgi:hypothetical protein